MAYIKGLVVKGGYDDLLKGMMTYVKVSEVTEGYDDLYKSH